MIRLAGMIIASSRTDYKVLSSNLSWLLIDKTSSTVLLGGTFIYPNIPSFPDIIWNIFICFTYITPIQLSDKWMS